MVDRGGNDERISSEIPNRIKAVVVIEHDIHKQDAYLRKSTSHECNTTD